jgi:CubicO group peptidase (beta-lactamase class C family)
MRHRRSLAILILVAAFASAGALRAAEPPSLAGHWEGAIEVPGTKLDVDLDFAFESGAWKGDISIPAQSARNLPLTGIALDGLKVTFAIKDAPGEPTFKGAFDPDGLKITGQMTQAGQAFPFSIKKGGDPAAKALAALEGFDKVVENGLAALQVPAIAMAVVKDDKVIFAEAFGFKDVEAKAPATPDTIFAIGSASKAFTVFALGKLVDEGKLEWDKPVRAYIPWFRLYDREAGERLTPRDLVTHRSGLPRHDAVWYNNLTASREDLVRRLAFLQPSADLRQKFQYNNLMFLTAGYLLETLTGQKWEDAVRALVFEPLGMRRSNFSVLDSQKDSDFALPYAPEEKSFKKLPFRDITTVGPAGSINSSVNEMAQWVVVHLANGKLKGAQILNAQTVEDMHTPHMTLGVAGATPEILAQAYGLGWFTDVYRGRRRVHHGGNIDGFSAMVSFFPNDGLGFVVLSNMNGTGLPELLIRTAADRILGLEAKDWIGEAAKRRDQGRAEDKKADEKKATRKVAGTKPSHPLADYAGDYGHPGYGEAKVAPQASQLVLTYNGISAPFEHWHYDTFNGLKGQDPTFEDTKISFRTDLNGRVAELVVALEAAADPIVFKKKPEARYSDPAFLKPFTGVYQLVNQTITVGLKGSVLTASLPGQPEYELVPDLGGEFTLKQVKVITVRFLMDAKGAVTGLEFIQPGGVYEAKKKSG